MAQSIRPCSHSGRDADLSFLILGDLAERALGQSTSLRLSGVAGADFEALLDRQSCGRAEHIADPQF